jgi:DNA polymerase-3 subunit chi
MGAAYFYHLTSSPLEVTLPMLLSKAQQAGWRIAVRGSSREHLEWLNAKLWAGPDEGFLPHGLAGGEFDADQPVLLTTQAELPNNATCLMSVDGADVSGDEVGSLDRVCILFDGNDQSALEKARVQWKALSDAGCAAQYWSQESGNWQKKAETEAS